MSGYHALFHGQEALYNIQRKIFFRRLFFLYYSPCPNLEGIKDALFYKFRRPTIGQNCSAACTNKPGHRDAFLNERCEAPHVNFERPAQQVTKPRPKRKTRSLVVDSTEWGHCHCSCYWPASRGVVYEVLLYKTFVARTPPTKIILHQCYSLCGPVSIKKYNFNSKNTKIYCNIIRSEWY